ncbi:VOC family protein [Hespellia stercorisuis]|uniref:Lactoylglutathione lyase n=1 Tax=Hespellia stercorisuis DSM 15480 TaxID=1121950 RepID=A0A1M6J4V7_9FIRM|nr:VOC family protein [Hespellia stercorisuis]SHJ41764.1 lactoylglutathione lyase [Hespellia stercorisuis DSM 15480]
MIKAMNHITINMKDKEKTFWFYGELLGLKKLHEVDMGDHYIYYYQLPSDIRLELIEYLYDTPSEHPQYTSRGIYRHVAFEVEDVQELKSTLVSNGIKILEGPNPSEKLGVHFMLIEDPNGVEMEFVQPL